MQVVVLPQNLGSGNQHCAGGFQLAFDFAFY